MPDQTTILVPIRYPLTDVSSRTLAAAGQLAQDHSPAHIHALHVNLMHHNGSIQTPELTRAISNVLEDVEASVIINRSYLVEEAILIESRQLGADIIVVGADQSSTWRRIFRHVTGNGPAIGEFLREKTTNDTHVVEVDMDARTPHVQLSV